MFNTLLYTKRLEEAGVSRAQAEVHIQIMAEVAESELATKVQLNEVRTELLTSIHEVRAEVTHLESRLIIKLSGIMAVMFTIWGSLMAFVLKSS